ncbi:MAG: hypothetical protein M3R36_08620 [Bacteroidota bacterium]|nr:hypothetical protein [Bacteroidota bacterium]
MNEKIKTDYLKFIFHKTNVDLTRYNITSSDMELVNKLFGRIISSDNLLRDLYILSQIKELRNIGKYFIFILKKIEDKVINYDNLSQNLHADVEFIENEILNYLSNPKLLDMLETKYVQSSGEDESKELPLTFEEVIKVSLENKEDSEENSEEDSMDEQDITHFKENFLNKKNYLELIQSDEDNSGNVYELPKTDSENSSDESGIAFELPDTKIIEAAGIVLAEDWNSEKTNEEKGEDLSEEQTENQHGDSFRIKGKLNLKEIEHEQSKALEQTLFDKADNSKEPKSNDSEEIEKAKDTENSEAENIQLSEEIQDEIATYVEEQKNYIEEENIFEEEQEAMEEQPTNALFLEYENQVIEQNSYLSKEFDRMISILNEKPSPEEERNEIIKNIRSASTGLEKISRDMSLELISNIYQTVTLSFEKISEGKYDISQSTLNLFKNGLSLVISLIKGDDYFGYKDILKSIENIRNALIEEREKREQYLKQQAEKIELEKKLSQKYPDNSQRTKITSIKKLVKDTEVKFNFLEKISGEYQIYEALRSLSGNLTNFKEIVKLSKELELKKLLQLSEASYIFLKFLQNYRINPVTGDIKEIFGYIIFNLKSLVIGKEVKDIDLFISYLNDPVKIFSKTENKK